MIAMVVLTPSIEIGVRTDTAVPRESRDGSSGRTVEVARALVVQWTIRVNHRTRCRRALDLVHAEVWQKQSKPLSTIMKS